MVTVGGVESISSQEMKMIDKNSIKNSEYFKRIPPVKDFKKSWYWK